MHWMVKAPRAMAGLVCVLAVVGCSTSPDYLRSQPVLRRPPGATLLLTAEQSGGPFGDVQPGVEIVWASPYSPARVLRYYGRHYRGVYELMPQSDGFLGWSSKRDVNVSVSLTASSPVLELGEISDLKPAPPGTRTFITVGASANG